MPRQQNIPLNRQTPVDPRNTFDYTTPNLNVVARPTDPYVQPTAGAGWAQLAESLSAINPALKAYLGYQQERVKQDFESGQFAAYQGRERPQTKAAAMGYDYIQGMRSASEYKTRGLALLQQFGATDTPEEFAARLDALEAEYLAGASEWFQRGFVENMLNTRDQLERAYQEQLIKTIHKDVLESLSQVIMDVSNQWLTDIADTIQVDPEQLAGNPLFYEYLSDDVFRTNLAQSGRRFFDTLHEIGKTTGLTRDQINAYAVQILGRKAIQLGAPELLDVFYVKDKNGVSIAAGSLGSTIEQYKRQAESHRQALIEAQDAQASELRKQQQQAALNQTYLTISLARLIENPMERANKAAEIREHIINNPLLMNLSPSEFRQLMRELEDMEAHRYSFPELSNDHVVTELLLKASFGNLTLQEVEEARAGFELSRSDYEKLLRAYQDQEEKKQSEQWRWEDKDIVERTINSAINYIGNAQAFGVLEHGVDAFSFQIHLYRALEAWREEHQRNPNYNEFLIDVLDPALKLFGSSLRDVMSHLGQTERPMLLEPPTVMEEQPEPGWMNRVRTVVNRIFPWVKPKMQEIPVPDPTATMSIDDAWYALNNAFDLGYTKPEIDEAFRDRYGMSDAARQYYWDAFAYLWASAYFTSEEYGNFVNAVRFIERDLRQMGFSDEEIQRAINNARGGINS